MVAIRHWFVAVVQILYWLERPSIAQHHLMFVVYFAVDNSLDLIFRFRIMLMTSLPFAPLNEVHLDSHPSLHPKRPKLIFLYSYQIVDVDSKTNSNGTLPLPLKINMISTDMKLHYFHLSPLLSLPFPLCRHFHLRILLHLRIYSHYHLSQCLGLESSCHREMPSSSHFHRYLCTCIYSHPHFLGDDGNFSMFVFFVLLLVSHSIF
mmetsp:Transcript_9783/g.14677  ORF Transcript_9783/g.14677 Transcript_9783/m.14677 type:complete len:206 (-) Transcript_9783:274-891(-)